MAAPPRQRVPIWRTVLTWKTLALAGGVGLFFFAVRAVPRMPRTVVALLPAFYLLPDLVAFVFAMVGLALVFMPVELRLLEGHRKIRLAIAGLIFLIGLGAVISYSVQKQQEKKEAADERDKLTGQIGDLIEQQKLSATRQEIQLAQISKLTGAVPELLRGIKGVTKPQQGPSPDVTLRFVYPKYPALVIVNTSDSIARDVKWIVALWNMDLPDRNDPLPIPVSIFDWLRPHTEGGPQNLFDGQLVAPLLKPGNRLFGSASVTCPDCPRGRTFVVYIVWGQGGWFSELEGDKSGTIVIPSTFLKGAREAYFKQLETLVPEKSRVLIGER